MFKLKTSGVFASELAGFLNKKLHGEDFSVRHPVSSMNVRDESFFCLQEGVAIPLKEIKKHKRVLILSDRDLQGTKAVFSYIITENPTIDFVNVLNEFFIELDSGGIAESACIDAASQIGKNVTIGENVLIGPDVTIGDNTEVQANVVITGRARIGKKCLIKHNSTIGSEGYDFVRDRNGNQIHFPNIGMIRMGNNVWIGANSSIESASLKGTVVEDNVKIDDLVQIGSDCRIGKNGMVTAGTIISRNVEIGKNSWIAPNVSIRDSIHIGDNVTIGIGAVVIQDLPSDGVYAGNPTRQLRKKKD